MLEYHSWIYSIKFFLNCQLDDFFTKDKKPNENFKSLAQLCNVSHIALRSDYF